MPRGWFYMKTRAELLAEAEETERMAALVSYRPDKQRLQAAAAELRRQAETASDDPPPNKR